MMGNNSLSTTGDRSWIRLAERPPPDPTTPKLLLRFWLEPTRRLAMGYYLGNQQVRLLGDSIGSQQCLDLDQVTHWQAVDEDHLREIESA